MKSGSSRVYIETPRRVVCSNFASVTQRQSQPFRAGRQHPSRPTRMSYSYESHFGPASELIEIGAFIQAAVHVETQLGSTGGRVFNTSTVSIIGSDALGDFPEDYRSSLSAECRSVKSEPSQPYSI